MSNIPIGSDVPWSPWNQDDPPEHCGVGTEFDYYNGDYPVYKCPDCGKTISNEPDPDMFKD